MNFGTAVDIWYVMIDNGDGSASSVFFFSKEEAQKCLDTWEEEGGPEATWLNEGNVRQVRVYNTHKEYEEI